MLFLSLALLATAPVPPLQASWTSAASLDAPWNVLVIVVDDIGVDQVGCYEAGYPHGEESLPPPCTPRLDAFAAEGVRFTNAWATPLCTPTRALLLTGRRGSLTGAGWPTGPSFPGNPGLQATEGNLVRVLKAARPETFCVALGKWHLADPTQGPGHPIELGFDLFLGSTFNLMTEHDHSFGDWRKSWSASGASGDFQVQRYATTDTVSDAIDVATGASEPWLLFVNSHASHKPFHCPADPDPASVGEGRFPCPAASCDEGWCASCSSRSGPCAGPGVTPDICQTRAMTEALDAELGRLLDALDASGRRQRTAILILSDNGTPRPAMGLPFDVGHGKSTVYQGGVNVPLLAWTPTSGAGRVCDELVSAGDLYETLLDLAQVPLVARPDDPGRESVSLAQYIAPARDVRGAGPRRLVFTERMAPNFVPLPGGGPPPGYLAISHYRALRNATHKLIDRRNGAQEQPEVEFYQLAEGPEPGDPALGPDPFESRNLYDPGTEEVPPAHAAAFASLRDELASNYPPLPTRAELELPLCALVSATRFPRGPEHCDSVTIGIGHRPDAAGGTTTRAFLDVDPGPLPAGAAVLELELILEVTTPAVEVSTTVELRAAKAAASDQPDCASLFENVGDPTFASAAAWDASGARRIMLNELAVEEFQSARCAGGPFSVALRLAPEDDTQSAHIGLADLAGGHRLRVTYRARIHDPCSGSSR